jgi:alpha-amylase
VKKINLALGVHSHQPVGNFDFVFQEGFDRAYRPFLEALYRHPHVKVALHYTGILLEWIATRYPEFVDLLREMVARGQVEMMTGGYYEPIMITIPDEDKLGQIAKLSKYVAKLTGYRPTGMWLAERIWEPHLPTPLSKAGIRYTVVDDSHFKYAGLGEEDLLGYYLTENEGDCLAVFPISERLRYTIPFQEPEVTLDYLRSLATEDGSRLVVFADDGEKFGIWPGTHTHCYAHGWLERFLTSLEENSDWITLVHFGEAVQHLRPVGRVYLPTASYREMMEWALPVRAIHAYEDFEQKLAQAQLLERYKVFVRGGFWRNFFAKYPEANHMHKRMLRVSRRLSQLAQYRRGPLIAEARNRLWAAQCNCPYWHGVFGGLYLNNLRAAIYEQLISAEVLLDLVQQRVRPRKGVRVEVTDFDADGHEEVIVESTRLNLYLAPDRGGVLTEWDYKPKAINLLDTLARREEGYHRKLAAASSSASGDATQKGVASIHDLILVKEGGLDRRLHYDWYEHKSLVDHFIGPDTTLEELAAARYDECGDFVHSPYEMALQKERAGIRIVMRRLGHVKVGTVERRVEVCKAVIVKPASNEVTIDYQLRNPEDQAVQVRFGVEFNVALQAGYAPDRYFTFDGRKPAEPHLASRGQEGGVHEVRLTDEWRKVRVSIAFDQPATVWRFPIETVSQSEGGFERVYQSSAVLPLWHLTIEAGESWRLRIRMGCEDVGYR